MFLHEKSRAFSSNFNANFSTVYDFNLDSAAGDVWGFVCSLTGVSHVAYHKAKQTGR